MSWNDSTNNQKIRNSRRRLAKKIQQLVRTDAKWKAEEGQDEGSDDTLKHSSSGEDCFFFFINVNFSGRNKILVSEMLF